MNTNVILAIFRRNFVSYFSSPTGYVFICVFVLLSSIAAFWPNEFFNANLANLNQLNSYLPYILLVFIPAITMSIWAEERRQGTDELLLTIPATDFDVVIGKFLAAVAIYSVSLAFSLLNIAVMVVVLGMPDFGLIFGNYVGYWLVGCAMLSVGMVASFLTSNLTVGFVLGALFNAPLVFAASADVIFEPEWALEINRWSLSAQFRDFGQGVVSFSGVMYFAMIIAVMLYLSMVLIGRRHWAGGKDGNSMGGHYLVRALSLIAIAVGAVTVVTRYADFRWDVTSEQLSSLAPQTIALLEELDPDRPVHIDAYVSPIVPESYVQTRLNLLSTLREFERRSGGAVSVSVFDTESYTETAKLANDQYGITGQQVPSRDRGAMKIEEIFMGLGVNHGLDPVVVPFVDRGVPAEYELIRSIATVTQEERKTVGVLTTDAKLYGGFDMQAMTQTQNEAIIDELEKQYEVVQVNADQPITEQYDVLLAVQPSSLTQPQIDNFIAAVRSGQPTAIFEDPFPRFFQGVPGTKSPRQPPGGGNPFMQQQQPPPQPKGEIQPLWDMLGINFNGEQIIWQLYNPFPRIQQFEREFVFIDHGMGEAEPFGEENAISSGLQQMLFIYPGAFSHRRASDVDFEPLVRTGRDTGEVPHDGIIENLGFMQRLNPNPPRRPTGDHYVLAAHIQGPPASSENLFMSDAGLDGETPSDGEPATEEVGEDADLNVVVVADIDVLSSVFFAVRNRGEDPEAEQQFTFDNTTFVLNTLDVLAGDDRFIDIRKRRRAYRTLTRLQDRIEAHREEADKLRDEYVKEFQAKQEAEQTKFDDEIAKLNARSDLDPVAKLQIVQQAQVVGQKRLEAQIDRLERERDQRNAEIETELAVEIRSVQNAAKRWAVILPPIPPLVVGVVTFFARRSREKEGVSRQRLR